MEYYYFYNFFQFKFILEFIILEFYKLKNIRILQIKEY
jgi:hypothetical protein